MELAVSPDLIDRLLALYCDWREECTEVQAAYERFSRASTPDRGLAFAAYTAALDREDSASEEYAAQVRLIAARSASDPGAFRSRRPMLRR